MKILACLLLVSGILLSGCSKEIVKVPYYQTIVVTDPVPPTPLVLRNPEIKAVGAAQLAAEASKPENSNKIYYVLSQEALSDLLNDDVDKLEYAKYETYRANFYKDAIEQFNKSAVKANATVDKKP